MFDHQIIHARELISRLERCQREGLEVVPASVPVQEAEHDAWYVGIERLISSAFGDGSPQVEHWQQLTLRLGDKIGQSIPESPDRSAIAGYVGYYNACIAYLRELETTLSLTESRPDSFAKAVLGVIWPSQRWARVVFVAITTLGTGVFALWASLPDANKDAFIRWLGASASGAQLDTVARKEGLEKSRSDSFGSQIPFHTGWIFIGYRDEAKHVFVEGPMAWVAFRPTGDERGQIAPLVGDILRIRKDRRVIIADYRTRGLRNQLTSPPLVKDPLTPEDETGVNLGEGAFVIVRDVETSGYPGRASSVWVRIVLCDEQTDACLRARDESR